MMKVEEFNFDVIVVGGGPAGSSAARMAAKNGCTVALIEKENILGVRQYVVLFLYLYV